MPAQDNAACCLAQGSAGWATGQLQYDVNRWLTGSRRNPERRYGSTHGPLVPLLRVDTQQAANPCAALLVALPGLSFASDTGVLVSGARQCRFLQDRRARSRVVADRQERGKVGLWKARRACRLKAKYHVKTMTRAPFVMGKPTAFSHNAILMTRRSAGASQFAMMKKLYSTDAKPELRERGRRLQDQPLLNLIAHFFESNFTLEPNIICSHGALRGLACSSLLAFSRCAHQEFQQLEKT